MSKPKYTYEVVKYTGVDYTQEEEELISKTYSIDEAFDVRDKLERANNSYNVWYKVEVYRA